MVMFSVPDDADSDFPMVADKDDDEATAMAMVNSEMMVSVNMPAIVSATFVAGASPIGLVPGDNAPFTYVSWNAMQSMVVGSGATFAVQAVEIGANQVAIPIGDATFVTCGPFECAAWAWTRRRSRSPTRATCNKLGSDGGHPGRQDRQRRRLPMWRRMASDTGNDGVDLGMVITSSVALKVKHVLVGRVERARTPPTTVKVAKSSTGADVSTMNCGRVDHRRCRTDSDT